MVGDSGSSNDSSMTMGSLRVVPMEGLSERSMGSFAEEPGMGGAGEYQC